MKNSLRWGDSALAGPAVGDRNLIPAYLVDAFARFGLESQLLGIDR